MAPGLGGSGSFRRGRRFDTPPRPARKPLEKGEAEKKWLNLVPPGSSTQRLERQKFKASPKPKELEAGFVYARACVVGDKIVASDDYGADIILQVTEVAPFMVVCRDIRTGRALGVLPDTIVQVAS